MGFIRKHPRWSLVIVIIIMSFLAANLEKTIKDSGNHNQPRVERKRSSSSSESSSSSHQNASVKKHSIHKKKVKHHRDKNNEFEKKLAKLDYHSGEAAFKNVNDGKSTLNPNKWHHDHIDYSDLDSQLRTSKPAIAYLDRYNVVNDSQRQRQYVQPSAWHQKYVNNEPILNRGHLIAYSLSGGIDTAGEYKANDSIGDQNNLKNLFTQTAFSNQKIQTIYESKVREALRSGDKVIYQVQPIFRGDELMARGVHLQAISKDGSLNFNVYLFNVQPGIKFNYQDGTSVIDHSMNVPTPAGAPNFGSQTGKHYTYHYHPYYHHSYYPYHHYYHHYYRHYYHHY